MDHLHRFRDLGALASPVDHAVGLVGVGMPVFAGWACLAGTLLLAGIVHRGARGGAWVPWVLLLVLVSAIAWLAGQASDSPDPRNLSGPRLRDPWPVLLGPAVLLGELGALLVTLAAGGLMWRAGLRGDAAARERCRVTLAGAGMFLACAAVLHALLRAHHSAWEIQLLGPRCPPLAWQSIPRRLLIPAALLAWGSAAWVVASVHLARGEEKEAEEGDPP